MNPEGDNFRLVAAIQSQLWECVKEAEPGFIQAMSTKDMSSHF